MVLGAGATVGTAEQVSKFTDDAEDDHFMEKVVSAQKVSAVSDDTDEDDTLSYFSKLAED